jgi:hypothetical protein
MRKHNETYQNPEVSEDTNGIYLDCDLSDVASLDDLKPFIGLPAGKYLVTLKAIADERSAAFQAIKLTFVVLSGRNTGRRHNERLFMSERGLPRAILFAKHLGLIAESDYGQTNVRKPWNSAIGKNVVIEIITEEFVTSRGGKSRDSRIKYDGIYSTDDPLVADVVAGNTVPFFNDRRTPGLSIYSYNYPCPQCPDNGSLEIHPDSDMASFSCECGCFFGKANSTNLGANNFNDRATKFWKEVFKEFPRERWPAYYSSDRLTMQRELVAYNDANGWKSFEEELYELERLLDCLRPFSRTFTDSADQSAEVKALRDRATELDHLLGYDLRF